MKKRKNNLLNFFVLLLFLTSCGSQKVNITRMTEEQRTTYLTNIAEKVFKKYPEFYKENVPVTIENSKTIVLTEAETKENYDNPNSPFYGMRPNQNYYRVNFHYNDDPEYVISSVYIREDTGKAFLIKLGSMLYPVKD